MILWVLLVFGFTLPLWADAEELRRVEQAEYLFEMEGQTFRAMKILQSLDSTQNPFVEKQRLKVLKRIQTRIQAKSQDSIPSSQQHPFQWSSLSVDSLNESMDTLDIGLNRSLVKGPTNYSLLRPSQLAQDLLEVDSACQVQTESQHYLYFICPNDLVWQLNLNQTSHLQSRQFNDLVDYYPLRHGGYILKRKSLEYYPTFQSKPSWSISGEELENAVLTSTKVILRSSNSIKAYSLRTQKLLWEKSNVQGELFQYQNLFGVITQNGYVQVFSQEGEFQWRAHLNKPFHHYQIDSLGQLNIEFKDYQKVSLQLQDIELHQRWDSQVKSVNSNNIYLIDSLLKIEPGNLHLWQLKVEHFQEQKGASLKLANALNQSLKLSKEINDPKSHILENYNQTIGAYWVRDLEVVSSFYPSIQPTPQGPLFIHSNTGNIHHFDPKTGKDLHKSQDSIAVLSSIHSHLGKIYTSFQDTLQIRDAESLSILDKISLGEEIKQITPTRKGLFVESWKGQLIEINLESNEVVWKKDFKTPALLHHYDSENNRIISVMENGTIHIRKLNTPSTLSVKLRKQQFSFAKVIGQNVYLVNQDKQLSKVSLTHFKSQWSLKMNAQIFSLQEAGKQLIIGLSNQDIISVNQNQGRLQWSWTGQNSLFVNPAIYRNKIYIDQGAQLQVLSLKTGKELSRHYYPTEVGSPQIIGQKLYLSSRSGILHSFKLK